MRRHDREITERAIIDAIIGRAQVLRLALAVNGQPYIVPLSYGYDGAAFYFHTAAAGRKLDMLSANPYVCFELEGDVRLCTGAQACQWSFSYESVIGYGTVAELVEDEAKKYGLRQVMLHYTGSDDWTFDPAEMSGTRLWRLTIERVTGKRA